MEEQNRQHTHSDHDHDHHHHHRDKTHEYRKHQINGIHKRKVFVKVAYWSLFTMAILSVIMVIIVYKFL